jgi:hypothetical protein
MRTQHIKTQSNSDREVCERTNPCVECMDNRCTLAARWTGSVMAVMFCGQGAPIILLFDADPVVLVFFFRASLPLDDTRLTSFAPILRRFDT